MKKIFILFFILVAGCTHLTAAERHTLRELKAQGIDIEHPELINERIINPEKGVKELIKAFTQLKDYSNIKLLIIGGSFFGNTKGTDIFITSLQEESKGIEDSIVFTGFVPYKQIPSYLAMCDVAVIPSLWEDPFPTTILEAMASGLPIIATNSGGITEACKDCAIIINKDNDIIRNLQESIIKLYNDKNLQYELSIIAHRRSRQYNQKRYCIEFYLKLDNL